ncbi:MAG: hypothetical protein RLY77_272 [Pseudomonadota bacterium]|jgi:pyruvate dehydrogenase E2 component (dihydrolipoamide acetyltransferase)
MAELKEARVPDIGGHGDVPVIELLVKPGDSVGKDQGLVTLESDKATMEVPSPFAGVIKELKVKLGDNVSEGGLVAIIEVAADAAAPTAAPAAVAAPTPAPPKPAVVAAPAAVAVVESGAPVPARAPVAEPGQPGIPPMRFEADAVLPAKVPYASPAVRLYARELGVDLLQVSGRGRNGRISREDVQHHVKAVMSGAPQGLAPAVAAAGGLSLLPWPKVDFAKFGAIESKPLSRIQKISGANLARNWAMIPHVTQFDEADITALEELRVSFNNENAKAIAAGKGSKLTMLAFLIKACVAVLQKYPTFNASLDGDNLVLKQYVHIGFAADTPNGLVVPVLRDADQKGVAQIAREMGELAALARDGKLKPEQMQGGCFTISSLGGIGGTKFTPIINAPEVAILGVSKSEMKPVWNGEKFKPRLMLPLSLSYDHRVIDGAAAARFTTYLGQLLADLRRAML